jgi:dihydrofolate reductase
MIISLIAAMDEQGGIGSAGAIPWHLPADLKRFKTLTMGHHLIMGRKTYQSIGRLLPGRTTIVVTRNPDFQSSGSLVCHNLNAALELANQRGETEVFLIGGGKIYEQAIVFADRLYLTLVHGRFETDVSFPPFNESSWVETERVFHPADERNPFAFTFRVLQRLKTKQTEKPG